MSNGRAEMHEDGGALLRRRWIGIASLPRFWTDVGSGLSAAWSGISAAAPKIIQAAGTSPDMQQQQAQAYMQPPNPDPANMSPQEVQKAVASELPNLATGTDAEQAAGESYAGIWVTP